MEDNLHIGNAVERTREWRPISKARIRDAMYASFGGSRPL